MTWWNFYFQIFEKAIRKEEVVESRRGLGSLTPRTVSEGRRNRKSFLRGAVQSAIYFPHQEN